MSEDLVFDLTPIEEPVTVKGKDGGESYYVLIEASGEAAGKYRDAQLACTKFGVDGKPSTVRGLAAVEPLLVSLCLYSVHDGANQLVPLHVIKSWPARIQKALFERAKEISELDEPDKEEDSVEVLEKKLAEAKEKADAVKNELEPTEGGSD